MVTRVALILSPHPRKCDGPIFMHRIHTQLVLSLTTEVIPNPRGRPFLEISGREKMVLPGLCELRISRTFMHRWSEGKQKQVPGERYAGEKSQECSTLLLTAHCNAFPTHQRVNPRHEHRRCLESRKHNHRKARYR